MTYWQQTPINKQDFSARREKISLVICTLNEAEGITEIIESSKDFVDEVLVVDGHSKDDTRALAEAAGARVILDNKKGKGDAIRCGIVKASGDVLVFMDADFSHDPRDIPKLAMPILEDKADLVVGSRIIGGSDELHGDFGKFLRIMGSYIITLGIIIRFNHQVTDSQNGFRALRRSVGIDLDLREDITTIEQEMLIKTLKKGYRAIEVSSHEYARRYGESRISLLKVSFRYVYSWLKYLIV